MARGLTDIAIRNLRSKPERYEVPDPGQAGLYVVVQPSGAKGYAVRYRFAGKPRKLTLQAGISLAAARRAAADALYQVHQGSDPGAAKLAARQAQRLAAADTFQAIAEQHFRREGDRLRTAAWQKAQLARLVYPALGPRPIGSVRRSELIGLHDKINEGSGPRDGQPHAGDRP